MSSVIKYICDAPIICYRDRLKLWVTVFYAFACGCYFQLVYNVVKIKMPDNLTVSVIVLVKKPDNFRDAFVFVHSVKGVTMPFCYGN